MLQEQENPLFYTTDSAKIIKSIEIYFINICLSVPSASITWKHTNETKFFMEMEIKDVRHGLRISLNKKEGLSS